MTVCDPIAGSGELALRRHGMTGERLLNMAYAVANAYCRKTGATLGDRIHDMAQHLALTATRRALNYKPELNKSSTFASYLWDIMEPACIDYFRRKAEGHGDRRYGHDNRIDLAGDTITEIAAQEEPASDDGEPGTRWRYAAWLVQQPFTAWPVVHERRVIRWQRAADEADLPLDEFIVVAADVYAGVMERRKAA